MDNGGGIADDNISKVFEPYFTTHHKTQGKGMGLYLAHEIISNTLEGSIDVNNSKYEYENKEYEGAQVTIKLPSSLKN